MKNIFGIRKQKGFESTQIDGHVFLDHSLDEFEEKEVDESLQEMQLLEHKVSLNTPLTVIKYISLTLVIIIGIGILRANVSLQQAYRNAPVIFYILPIFLLLWLSISGYEKSLKKNVDQDQQKALEGKIEQLYIESKASLGIPDGALIMDAYGLTYKIDKNDKVIVNKQSLFQYFNMSFHFYIKDNDLYISDTHQVLKIPVSSIVGYEKINKNSLVQGWNKDINPNEGKYKPYKIRVNQFQSLYIKPYYKIIINDEKGDFEFFIPSYELEDFIGLFPNGLNQINGQKDLES